MWIVGCNMCTKCALYAGSAYMHVLLQQLKPMEFIKAYATQVTQEST